MISTAALLGKVDQQQKTIKTMRERAEEGAEKMAATVFGVAAGPLVAWFDTAHPNSEYFGFSTPMLLGAAATVSGLMGWAGAKYSGILQSFGGGVLTVEAYKAMRARLAATASQPKT